MMIMPSGRSANATRAACFGSRGIQPIGMTVAVTPLSSGSKASSAAGVRPESRCAFGWS